MKNKCKICNKESVYKVTFTSVKDESNSKEVYDTDYYNKRFGGYFCTEHAFDEEFKT